MSSDANRAEIISESLAFLISNYFANAGSGLIIYEHLITFGREVELFWKRRLTGAALLFYFNRYLALCNNVYGIVMNMPISDKECPAFARSSKILNILQYFPWAVFAGLRAFALSRHGTLSTFVFLLSCVPLGINYSHFAFHSTGWNNPMTGCLTTDDVSSALSKKMTIASRSCLITADVLLIYITWFNMYRRSGPKHPTVRNRFMDVLLRDGTLYFVVLAFLNALHLTLSLLSIQYKFRNISYVTQFSEPITTILVSRFLLHLQSANRSVLHLDSPDGTLSVSGSASSSAQPEDTLVFERVIGSLGESIDLAAYRYEDELDDEKGKDKDTKEERGEDREPEALRVPVKGSGDLERGTGGRARGGGEESVEMTPLSSPQSAAGQSAA